MKLSVGGLALLLPVIASAYPDGAPPAHTGGFSEPHCGACHLGETQPRSLTVSGLPDRYIPGNTYTVKLGLPDAQVAAAGFQVSVRFIADGTQAGALRAGSSQQLQQAGGVGYLTHTESLAESQETRKWILEWMAPADRVAPLVFHAAVVAGNHDESPLGDRVYLLMQKLEHSDTLQEVNGPGK